MNASLTTQRILSIDAFRGITILVMIFVNELAGVHGIPVWMKHMPADANAMTFVDVVFPAFLFIVGMSIPFAINNRLSKGDNPFQLQKHILVRTLGLLVLGVFMVNAEGGQVENAMPISIHLWSLLFCACVILVWNVYTIENKTVVITFRVVGIVGLILLALIFRGGEDGTETIIPKWWGILGLIGWAYFIACMLYQIFNTRLLALLMMICVCVAYYVVGHLDAIKNSVLHPLFSQGGHAVHTSIVLCGVVLSLIFFDETKTKMIQRRFAEAFMFVIILVVVGYFLRPYFKISKIYATPTWCLYCSAICVIVFSLLYWIIDLKKKSNWTAFFRPAAANPLLTYIIPFIVYAAMQYFNLSFPDLFSQGVMGMLWSACYAVMVMGLVIGLNRLKIKLQL